MVVDVAGDLARIGQADGGMRIEREIKPGFGQHRGARDRDARDGEWDRGRGQASTASGVTLLNACCQASMPRGISTMWSASATSAAARRPSVE